MWHGIYTDNVMFGQFRRSSTRQRCGQGRSFENAKQTGNMRKEDILVTARYLHPLARYQLVLFIEAEVHASKCVNCHGCTRERKMADDRRPR